MTAQLVVIAKAPAPGRVKTRLCPPCTPAQAARIAAAALADTLDTVSATPAAGRALAVDGTLVLPRGWTSVPQRGVGLGERLAAAFADTWRPGSSSLLLGMDTPQVTVAELGAAADRLRDADAVLGPAEDGGWWALGLHDPAHAEVLRTVPMSTSDTGAATLRALRDRGLTVALLPTLRDVDTAVDALAVARLCAPGSRFGAAVSELVPA